MCIEYLQNYVVAFQDRRSKVTDAVVNEFMSTRPLEWKGNPRVPRADLVVPVTKSAGDEADGAAAGDDGKMTKNQLKKLLKQQQIAQKKAEQAKEKEAAPEAAASGGS